MEEAMRAKGLSYRDLGFIVDRDPGYLNRIAKKAAQPSRATALAIGKALGIDPMEVLDHGEAGMKQLPNPVERPTLDGHTTAELFGISY